MLQWQREQARGGWTIMGAPNRDKDKFAAQKMLGEVDGEQLLQKLSKDVLQSGQRRSQVVVIHFPVIVYGSPHI
jgi:hypothetical protein